MDAVRVLAFILAWASALLALASVGGAFSARFDVLTHFTPFYLAGGVVAFILALLSGSGTATFAGAAAAVLIPAAMMAPDLVEALTAPRSAPSGQTVRLIQFNLWSENRDPAGTAAWIEAQDADVVVVEEAVTRGAIVAAYLSDLYPFQTSCRPRPTCTTLILSKTPPEASGVFPTPDHNALHSGAWASFGTGPEAFTVAATHLTWPFPPGRQQSQADRLAGELKRFDRSSLILAGDFNSTPWSFTLRRLDAQLGLVRRTHALFSWPVRTYGKRHRLSSPFPFLPIDQVYAGGSWKTVSVKLGPRLGSDHLPVVVVLTRNDRQGSA